MLFDLDGTLVDTNIDFSLMRSEMLRLAQEYGAWDAGMQAMDILGIIDRACETLNQNQAGGQAGQLRVQAMDALQEIEIRHALEAQEIPHALELLQELKDRNIRTAVVTRNCRAASRLSMEVVGIEADVVVCREDTSKHKPLPEPVLTAMERLSVQPEQAVMVGDHPMDIYSAKAAGCFSIAFLRDDRPRDLFDQAEPDMLITSLGDIRFAADNIDC